MEETLSGLVTNIVFKNDETGYAIIELETREDTFTVTGEMAHISPGEEVEISGEFTEHPTYGIQFKATSCVYHMPESETAILRYLSGGALTGIGPAIARRIVSLFGEASLETIALYPEKIAKIKGLSLQKAKAISEQLKRTMGVREVISYFAQIGIGTPQALAAYKQYGETTLQQVSQNIYLLCAVPVLLPFEQADAIAFSKGVEQESDIRLKAGILYVLRHNTGNGHTCLPQEKLLSTVSRFLKVEPENIMRAVDEMEEKGELVRETFGESTFLFLPDLYLTEQRIASALKAIAQYENKSEEASYKELDAIEKTQPVKLTSLQKQAVEFAITNRCFVLTGGPGTGKTTTIKAIIEWFESKGDRVFLAAPTGRAAKRLSELSGREAKTIHRMLEVGYGSAESIRFLKDENNPLKCEVLVIDEMSMVDVFLFEAVLRALKPNCKLILVGDSDQLPSVGAGNVLKDIIASEIVPTVRLTQIFRQAEQSKIVVNAHRIVNGELPIQGQAEDDFFAIESTGVQCKELVCNLVTQRLPAKYGYSSLEDIQILCPSRIGIVGTEQLNRELQERLNPPTHGKKQVQYMNLIFREGDKVMQVRNNYDIPYERKDGFQGTGAFNGDIGFIEKVDLKAGVVTVRYDDRVYIYLLEQLKELELAYAVTIHKSQGSEFEAVIIPISETPAKLCYRNLLYTGVTRAKKLLVMPGSSKLVAQMVHNNKKMLRYSALYNFLKDDAFI